MAGPDQHPLRDLPPEYGPWQTVYELFRRWKIDGTWTTLLTGLQARADAAGLITWEVTAPVGLGGGPGEGGFEVVLPDTGRNEHDVSASDIARGLTVWSAARAFHGRPARQIADSSNSA